MTHPLSRLTATEIDSARAVLESHDLLGPEVRVPVLALEEPSRAEVAAHRDGDPVDRRVRAVLLDPATGTSRTVIASLTRSAVDSTQEHDPVTDGQPPITGEEMEGVDAIVKADPGWLEAMARRGITDVSLVAACPLSAGSFGLPGEQGRRMLRVLSFLQHRRDDSPWAHPVDGVVAYVDLLAREVVELIDTGVVPVPQEEGNFGDGPYRESRTPLHVSQPDGASFAVSGDGEVVDWENWRFRIGFDPREGLVLHQLSFAGRPVAHRLSVAEMVVPYADPGPVRFWQNYFDAGEYLLGHAANSLELGCDCVGEIHYVDAVVADAQARPRTIGNAICLHEEDDGVLWKHTDLFTGKQAVRRRRRLVVSFFATIGNYDYGFYWYLHLDGSVELEVKSTGVVFTGAYDERAARWATEIAPGLGAPYHQHLFCARLDLTVDGPEGAVDELDVRRLPVSAENPYGNAFERTATRIGTERDGGRVADRGAGRVWRVSSSQGRNRFGEPTGYVLEPEDGPTLLADDGSSIAARAAFATRHLWVTAYDPARRYPAGELVNQHAGGSGIPEWVAEDRAVDGAELTLWHTFGVTHFPRTEDWPVMPTASCGFRLAPSGFFDRNPTLDVAPGH
ncbi:primary-amine oxidase [Pseudonocardia sp. HH130630-07]|uniref:primary-amine oxidase n=1 Tax=Pseudonocardia sp. HH130630-07 TaxID=1690815 RepID=UPI000814F146|nr:primary-amine oxidase [Pseudonocardia sp. HH130630-07]ANY05301.1 tyramine oxidase [Pseudonocardia sp. HH130630-07]